MGGAGIKGPPCWPAHLHECAGAADAGDGGRNCNPAIFNQQGETAMKFGDLEMKALELAAYAALASWAIGAAVFAAMLV